MKTEKLKQLSHWKSATAVIALLIGITVGYGISTATQPKQETSYCQSLEKDLVQEYNTTALNCHEPEWVALSKQEQAIENQTNMRCVCTRVQDGRLTIFPIRVAE